MNVCECGCGEECRFRYVRGHWLIGKERSDETKRKISLNATGKKHIYVKPFSEEHKQRISLALVGHKKSDEWVKSLVAARRRNGSYTISKEQRELIALRMIGNLHSKGRKVPKEERALKSLKNKMFWESHPEISQRIIRNNGKKKFPYIFSDGRVIKMRSGWEIEYAKWLDVQKITWLYEPWQFRLSNGTRYWPDFFLPELKEYHEVKGYMTEGAKIKLQLFRREYPEERLVLVGKVKGAELGNASDFSFQNPDAEVIS